MRNILLKQKLILFHTAVMMVLLPLVPTASAQEVAVTENGAVSENTVDINNTSSTTIHQDNNAQINNNVTTSSTTGGNSADYNTGGDTAIVTGDASQTTEINNNANTNVVKEQCCDQNGTNSTTISGNGAGSDNNVDSHTSSQTSVTSTNNATIINNITEKANTGGNNASGNNGDVRIFTGDINSSIKVNNSVNTSKIKLSKDRDGETEINIKHNGALSENNARVSKNNRLDIDQENNADIENNIKSFLNTGNNWADYNNGDVIIKTGNIISNIEVNNDVNKNIVKVICCEEKEKDKPEKPEEQPAPPVTQPTPSQPTVSNGNGHGQPTAQEGQVAAAVAKMLPVTGGGHNWIFLSIFANILMLLLGTYLRLRSGNSPGLN